AGLGFLLAMVLFAGVRSRIAAATNVPKAFQGMPITLAAAAIVSAAFMGFSGIIDNLFK
ncbi:MAG TPA: electron transport complex protein RnfA, partial [Firmicutes bacterium]|nr:electron transport complex protein RnfA [Bacillota bacterium]